MHVSWDDIGRSSEPGLYEIGGEDVQIDQKHIKAWEANPEEVFEAMFYRGNSSTSPRYLLGKKIAG